MKLTSILLKFSLLVLIAFLTVLGSKCAPPDTCYDIDGGQCFNIDSFAMNIRNKMSDSCMGYGFVIYRRDTLQRFYNEGLKRTQANGGPLNFDNFSKVHLASLSKTITAIAALQLLKSKNLTTYAKIKDYLPADWTLGANVDKITFRDLLRHESGIRNTNSGYDGHTYGELKGKIQGGVIDTNMGKQSYHNQNTALFRIIISKLLGFPDMPVANDAITASNYIKYVQDSVLAHAQVSKSYPYPDTASYQFYYRWPYANSKGAKFGDHTLYVGATGWFVSVTEFGSLINKLVSSEVLLNANWRDTMLTNNLGCFDYGGPRGPYKWHNGFTGDSSAAGYGIVNTCWMYFPKNQVVAVCFANSDIPNSGWFPGILADAYNKAWIKP